MLIKGKLEEQKNKSEENLIMHATCFVIVHIPNFLSIEKKQKALSSPFAYYLL